PLLAPGPPAPPVSFGTDESACGTPQKVTKSTGAGNEDNNDDDQIDDQDEEDGEGEEESKLDTRQFQKPQHLYDFAISGIVVLDVHKDFPQHADLLSECRAVIELQYPKIRRYTSKLVDDDDGLKEARLGELMKQLQENMSRFKNDSDEMVTIEILRTL
ncbi:hypothetical protein BGZ65_008786, partial [Modicella reniformis]